MTPGENSPSTPEDDDPFGYLYADGQARGAQPPSGGYGYPNSVSRVRSVGERTYGGQQAQSGVPQQQGTYGQPNAHYQAPETLPGGAPTSRQPAQTPARGGPNTKGLLIGAIAVVAAVVIGISIAMLNDNGDDNKSGNQAGASPTQSQTSKPSPSGSGSAAPGELPKTDASALQLGPGVTKASDIKGAKAQGGTYVTGFNHVGATVTWTINDLEKAGSYRLYVRYGIPGVDANATLVVNNKVDPRPMSMKNFGGGTPAGDWEKGWKTTWSNVNLNKGANTIQIACNDGNQCNANLDQLWLVKG
ncbi:carbohydrate-binding protein [Streptomyces sp. NPDC001165]|uniref:carbohydrate-binding protein n=1 Tax=Streptomyces sp. NPDC001165 TaxID=3364546 RepID=UPI0036B44CE5